jgi:hypothetical protein
MASSNFSLAQLHRMKRRKPARFDQNKEVRAIARERVGSVKAGRVMVPKPLRKKPKHKKPLEALE